MKEIWTLTAWLDGSDKPAVYKFVELPRLSETSTVLQWSAGGLIVGISTHELISYNLERSSSE